jgi:Na+-transporting methylmalonyl-CoA/oxaloacetate decarboxylase gamma subunit
MKTKRTNVGRLIRIFKCLWCFRLKRQILQSSSEMTADLFPNRMSEIANRPTFLTVLCFLTFMSSVSGLWTQSERLWNPGIMADKTRETFEAVRENLDNQNTTADTQTMDKMFESVIGQTTAKTITTGAIIMLIFESFSLYAAYLMWNLQKKGFYLYMAGIGVAFLAPLFLIGGWLGVITSIAGIFLSIFMLILYAFNLKHME